MQGKLAVVDIHNRIKTRRTHLKLSQEQLAVKVSQLEGLAKPLAWQTVQQWETSTVPRHRRLQHVATALEMQLDELMGAPASATPKAQVQSQGDDGWPFQVVARDQVTALSPSQLAALEKAMVKHLLQPDAGDFRATALDVAAQLDHRNNRDDYTRFIRTVDLKLQATNAAKRQEATTP
jgi:transcriptional regulator with XRE-family HTH domain